MRLRPVVLPISLILIVLVVATSCGPASDTEPPIPSPANPLQGVWSVTAIDPGDGSDAIDPSQPGLYIFAEGHYSAVYAPGAEPRVLSATPFVPTPEEMAAQHRSIIVNTGTYEISGSTITFRPIIAKSPEFVGGHATSEFQISGDVLTLRLMSVIAVDGAAAPNVGGTQTLRRVE